MKLGIGIGDGGVGDCDWGFEGLGDTVRTYIRTSISIRERESRAI